MNRIRLLAIGTMFMLMIALTVVAQQTTTSSDPQGGSGGVPTAQEQLKVLTEKLNLTGDQ